MAIVFVSPKKKQRIFFIAGALIFVLVLAGLSVMILLPEFADKSQQVSVQEASFDASAIAINVGIIDSNKVMNLKPMDFQEKSFAYLVRDPEGRQTQGTISAISKADAVALLEETGFEILNLEELNVGRTQPFVAY